MRKGWKVFWIVCVVVVVIGFVCCIAALGLGVTRESIFTRFPHGIGFVKYGNHGFDYETIPYDGDVDASETFSGIREIDAYISAGDFQILKSDTEEVKIETAGVDSRLKLRYYVEDGELIIKTRKHFTGMTGVKSGTVYLFLPENFNLEEADLELGAGVMYIQDISARCLDIHVGAGEATIDSFTSDEVSMDCGAGTIYAYGRAIQDADIDCGIGRIDLTLAGRKEDYSYSVKCGIGEVGLAGETYSGLGSERQIDNRTGREIEIDCGIGSVDIQFENISE